MSNDNDLDSIPAIAPEKDELDSRRRNMTAPKPSNFRGLLVFCLVLMAVVLGIGGYSIYEVQIRLDRSNELLETANRNVRDLEARLAATGMDVSKELQTLKEQQATNFSEIDKLWKVAYRENRPDIKKLETSVASLTKGNSDTAKIVAGLKTEVEQSSTRVSNLATSMDKVKNDLLAESDELKTSLSLVRGQIQDNVVQTEGQKRAIAAITQQLKDIDEAIEAIDQYRRQMNQRLLELQNPPPTS